MRGWMYSILNYLIFVLAGLALAAAQSTLWFQFFGHFPPANLWLPVMVFWLLYRETFESVAMTYLMTVVVCAFTSAPLSLMLMTNAAVLLIGFFVKRRLFQPTTNFFMLVCGAGAGLVIISHTLVSMMWEKNPITEFPFFYWLIQSLLTMLVAWPCYKLFNWLDRITQKERPAETGVIF